MSINPEASEGQDHESLQAITRYDRDRFFSRLGELARVTQGYNGTLLDAGQNLRKVGEGQESSTILPDGPVPNHMVNAVSGIENCAASSVVIEAGHVYQYETLENEDLVASLEAQFNQAMILESHLRQRGVAVSRMLFIDDYNPHPETGEMHQHLDEVAYFKLAEAHGYGPFQVVYESDMAPLAEALIDHMLHVQGIAKVEEEAGDDRRILLQHRNIELKRGDKVSCAALDAALCLVKYAFVAESSVNALPPVPHVEQSDNLESFSYQTQQRKTRKILYEHLNTRVLPFFNVFVSSEAEHSSGSHHTLRKRRRS